MLLQDVYKRQIINGAILVLIWVAGNQVYSGAITQGETVALWNYMSQILVELIKLANLIINISKALACANRVQKVFEEKSSITDGTKEGQAAPDKNKVVFDKIRFFYGGSKEPSLDNISLSVEKGQTVGIIAVSYTHLDVYKRQVIMDEIGCGIVPVQPEDRVYRDLAGYAGQLLAEKAEIVYRVTAGIGVKIKDVKGENT